MTVGEFMFIYPAAQLGVVWWLAACALAGWCARQKARSVIGWFVLALVFTPLMALVALAAVPRR